MTSSLSLVLAIVLVGCAAGAARRGGSGTISNQSVDSTADGVAFDPFTIVVRRRVLRSFEALGRGDPSAALALMADDVHYTFEGDHALGGTRVSRQGVERWFGRLRRLLPGRFVIRSVRVLGGPWRATVYTVFEDVVTPAFGAPYRNHGVQIVDLRWGKAVRIRTYVNTAVIERALRTLAEHGVAEASAPPITD